jgi:fatty-acid desaturase
MLEKFQMYSMLIQQFLLLVLFIVAFVGIFMVKSSKNKKKKLIKDWKKNLRERSIVGICWLICLVGFIICTLIHEIFASCLFLIGAILLMPVLFYLRIAFDYGQIDHPDGKNPYSHECQDKLR